MKLIITIDTEEDNWDRYSATDNPLSNIYRIPALQCLFNDFGVKPTYMVTYPVATNPRSVEILKHIVEKNKCEIGAHCHPWNTPPYKEEKNIFNSMLCNLPEELQFLKIESLTNSIRKNFGFSPVGFRAGRWAFGNSTARAIHKLGFKVDSSVTPYTDWSKWHGANFRDIGPRPYRFSPSNIFQEVKHGELIQLPASIGFLQKNYEICKKISNLSDCCLMQKFRVRGILNRLKILNKVELSPEMSTSQNMIALAKRMQGLGFEYLNMFFHSASLVPGISPFVRNRKDELNFFKRLGDFFSFTYKLGMESITISKMELGSSSENY
jgi:hypothetical protein